jgi:hypothetical protein
MHRTCPRRYEAGNLPGKHERNTGPFFWTNHHTAAQLLAASPRSAYHRAWPECAAACFSGACRAARLEPGTCCFAPPAEQAWLIVDKQQFFCRHADHGGYEGRY